MRRLKRVYLASMDGLRCKTSFRPDRDVPRDNSRHRAQLGRRRPGFWDKPSKLNIFYNCETCGRETVRPWEAEPDKNGKR
jgi:hypothetical protein